MTPLLRDLMWAIALVALFSFGLDLQDSNARRLHELNQAQRLLQRDALRGQQIDWVVTEAQALKAQKQWLGLLAPVVSGGKFRAEALESLADLCIAADVQCRLSAGGENVEAVAIASQRASQESSKADRPIVATAELGQLMVAVSKVTLPLQGESLSRFLLAVESSDQLRVVDKLSARGTTVDLQIKTFGMQKENLAQLMRSNHAAITR